LCLNKFFSSILTALFILDMIYFLLFVLNLMILLNVIVTHKYMIYQLKNFNSCILKCLNIFSYNVVSCEVTNISFNIESILFWSRVLISKLLVSHRDFFNYLRILFLIIFAFLMWSTIYSSDILFYIKRLIYLLTYLQWLTQYEPHWVHLWKYYIYFRF
jgi:hypothetical protein